MYMKDNQMTMTQKVCFGGGRVYKHIAPPKWKQKLQHLFIAVLTTVSSNMVHGSQKVEIQWLPTHD